MKKWKSKKKGIRKVRLTTKRNGKWLYLQVGEFSYGATTKLVERRLLVESAVIFRGLSSASAEELHDRLHVLFVDYINDENEAGHVTDIPPLIDLTPLALAVMHEDMIRNREIAGNVVSHSRGVK